MADVFDALSYGKEYHKKRKNPEEIKKIILEEK